jgi:predicted  nucleic acid-binding Zn-ribbon protein
MIATEAASEGINLQFCSLIANFDLPWNPQRVEQRIGRCHRYGQKNDVVVINFINKANRADQRVYELLDEKYNLFKGVFGSSDEVLGKAMDGLDFEHRVLDIYQSCRGVEEIDKAFDRLQAEMQSKIEETISDTQSKLIENFDQDVVNKLRLRKQTDELRLTQFQELLWKLTIAVLKENISKIDSNSYKFSLLSSPTDSNIAFETGPYQMGKAIEDAYTYRIGHPLAEYVLNKAKTSDTTCHASLTFDYSSSPNKVSILEEQMGKHGSLSVSLIRFNCTHETEEHIVAVALDADGNLLPNDFVSKLMMLSTEIEEKDTVILHHASLEHYSANASKSLGIEINERSKKFINEESEKISRWADDQTFALEQELRDIKRRIKEKERAFNNESDASVRLELQKEIQTLQRQMKQKRQALFMLEDEIDERRHTLIRQIEASLNQTVAEEKLFTINWKIK